MHPDGSYEQLRPGEGDETRNAQETFMRETEEASR